MSESIPLLRSSSVKRRCFSCLSFFRLLLIHSKGAVLVLFWDLLIAIAQYNVLSSSMIDHANGRKVEIGLAFTFIVAGYLGDFLISRHRLILAGLYSSFVLLIFLLLMVSLQLMSLMSTGYPLLIYKILCFTLFITVGAVRVNLLPFNIDQLIGSSSDELTAIIHWHNLGPLLSPFIIINADSFLLMQIFWLGTIIVCVAAVLVSHGLFNHCLETTPVNTVNPVKLIVRVLCYARKHKYPENRSALTYWEEEAPSRLDLGKDKYGGPFTEEEVEDVKTVLRLLPLVFIFGLSGGLYGLYTVSMSSMVYGCSEGQKVWVIVYVFLLIFMLLISRQSYFRKYIPSMLKRIGMGLTLIVLVNILYTVLAIIGNYQFGEIFHCLTVFAKESLITKPQKWLYFDEVILAIFWYINNVVAVEFILAQCPKSMRGTLIGLWLCLRILRSDLNFIIFLPFLQFMGLDFPLGRGFYFLLTLAVLSFLGLVLFIFLAKRYKLRVREVEIPINRIAEDHIIRYIEQDEEHRIDYSSSSSDNEEV